jgi:hypothetical protein
VAGTGKKNCDEALLTALAAGGSVAAAAHHAGVSERTARRRLASAEFRARVDEARAAMVGQAVGRLASVGALAGDTLRELLDPGRPPAVRLGAARSVLEFMFRGHELDTLARQVADLQRRLAEVTTNGPGGGAAEGGADGSGAGPDGGTGDAGPGPAAAGPGIDPGGGGDEPRPVAGRVPAGAGDEDVAPLFPPGG